MSDAFPDRPPKPRLTLRVGVTGKRAIPAEERERIRNSLDEVFRAIGTLLVKCHSDNPDFFSKQVPLLRINSGMAEGADQIAAEVAIKLHRDSSSHQVETRLAAILPFLQAEYEKDFKRDPSESEDAPDRPEVESKPIVEHFQKLLCDPAVESILQIDDEALRTSGDKKIRDRAYGNLGEILLEHTDVLVAVSNDKYGGAGGTVDVLGAALRMKIPVIKISTLKPSVYSLLSAEPDAANPTPIEAEQINGAELPQNLAELIGRTLEPPPQNVPQNALHHHGHDAPRPVRERLNTFFNEEFKSRFFDRVFKAFREAFSARPGPHEYLIMKFFSGTAAFVSIFWSYRKKLRSADEVARDMWPDTLNRFTADNGAKVKTVLAARHGWADAMAVSYADATRSAHIMLAGLAASAVLMALMPFVLWDHPDEAALRIKVLFLLLELGVLAAAWALFQPARKGRWHERFVEYRAVAELLRHERFIYALGAADRPGRAADRTWSEPDASPLRSYRRPLDATRSRRSWRASLKVQTARSNTTSP